MMVLDHLWMGNSFFCYAYSLSFGHPRLCHSYYVIVASIRMSFSSGSRESERCRWVLFGGVARLLMNYHVLLFMSVVVTSQCLNVVYIVVSNCLLS